jgi:hypothetical protein
MKKSYSAHDFRRALATSSLDDQPPVEGMAKADDNDQGILLFSAAGCERWTPIPLDLVLEVEHLGSTRCKDHEHPFVRIHLKAPETPEARMLAGLLAAHAMALRASSDARPGAGFCAKFCSECDRCGDPDCDACQKCARCSSSFDARGSGRRGRPAAGNEEDCQLECGNDHQSCIESCDPRDAGCFYGCKLRLSRCLRHCR